MLVSMAGPSKRTWHGTQATDVDVCTMVDTAVVDITAATTGMRRTMVRPSTTDTTGK